MVEFVALFFKVLSPVLLIILVGYLAKGLSSFDVKTISRLDLYILAPALAFRSLIEASITSREIGSIILFAVLLIGTLTLFGYLVLPALGIETEKRSAFLLSSTFLNCGNYGLPVLLFAFGTTALGPGIVFLIVHMFLIYTLGVFFASSARGGLMQSLASVFKMPALYAAAAAVLFKAGGFAVPEVLFQPIDLLSYAAIPVELLILGMQLSGVKITSIGRVHLAAGAYRLVISPLLGAGLVALLGIGGLTGKVLILESAFPTAVLATVLATEFDGDADFASTTTLVTTAASLLTVGFILTII